MELENIILSEISQVQKAKATWFRRPKPHVLSHMWNTDPTQIQQYYEKLFTLWGGHI
jgi:hypothetical protein